MQVFDTRPCQLGEGPLWHPLRQQLFWFDILGKRLMTQTEQDGPADWSFGEQVSAAGWIDRDTLLIASETRLFTFNLITQTSRNVAPLEAGRRDTRSNDGRADPWGGFWIGTMGKNAEAGAGAIYRYYKGALRQLHDAITVPNAICFAPLSPLAYFTDTETGQVMRQRLDPATGWPIGQAELFLDLTGEGLKPDGAVVDTDGRIWIALWGSGRVAAYTPEGQFDQAISLDATHSTCPAFGGADLSTLFCTSALMGLIETGRFDGLTFSTAVQAKGQAEHQVIL